MHNRTRIKYLSRSKILNCFVTFNDAIEIFMSEIDESFFQLKDKNWILKLKLLTDITNHLNNLNIHYRSKNRQISNFLKNRNVFVVS